MGDRAPKKTKASNAFAKENGNLSIDEKLEKIKDIPYMGQPLCNEQGIMMERLSSHKATASQHICPWRV